MKSITSALSSGTKELVSSRLGDSSEKEAIKFACNQKIRELMMDEGDDDLFLGLINSNNAGYLPSESLDGIVEDIRNFHKEANETFLFKSNVIKPIELKSMSQSFDLSEIMSAKKGGGYMRISRLFVGFHPLVSACSEETGVLSITLHDNRLKSSCIRTIEFNTTIPGVGFMCVDYCIPMADIKYMSLKVKASYLTVKKDMTYGVLKLKAEIECQKYPVHFDLVRTEHKMWIPEALIRGDVKFLTHTQATVNNDTLLAMRSKMLEEDSSEKLPVDHVNVLKVGSSRDMHKRVETVLEETLEEMIPEINELQLNSLEESSGKGKGSEKQPIKLRSKSINTNISHMRKISDDYKRKAVEQVEPAVKMIQDEKYQLGDDIIALKKQLSSIKARDRTYL